MRLRTQMFRGEILQKIPAAEREVFLQRMEDFARPELYRQHTWIADYVRLRAIAIKPA